MCGINDYVGEGGGGGRGYRQPRSLEIIIQYIGLQTYSNIMHAILTKVDPDNNI